MAATTPFIPAEAPIVLTETTTGLLTKCKPSDQTISPKSYLPCDNFFGLKVT